MNKVTIVCNRCHKKVHGLEDDQATTGFYRTTKMPWKRYARKGETVVCDACLQSDAGYRRDYATASPSMPKMHVEGRAKGGGKPTARS